MLFAPRIGGTSTNESQKEDTGEKSQDVFFSENRFCSPTVWDLLRLTPWVFWSETFTSHSSLCLLSFGEVWAPDSSHKIGNKFFIPHCQGWKEGSFVCETVWFFRGWILIRLTWNLSSFVPNSVEILGWNFRKKLFRENFSEILCKPRRPKLVKFRPNFCNFILGLYRAEKNSQEHFRMLFAPRQGGTSTNESQKEDTGKKSQDVLFSENWFCSPSVRDVLRLTP